MKLNINFLDKFGSAKIQQQLSNHTSQIQEQNNEVTVEEIHESFNSIGDQTLSKYKSELERLMVGKDLSRAERLANLGFTGMKEVSDSANSNSNSLIYEYRKNIFLYENIKKIFPFNNFLEERDVEGLCEKYKLVLSDVNRYKWEIPENNLLEIEEFVKNYKNKLKTIYVYLDNSSWNFEEYKVEFISQDDGTTYLKTKDPELNIITKIEKNNYGDRVFRDCRFDYGKHRNVNDKELKVFESIENLKFSICAPIELFDTTNTELRDGYKLERLDPIVLLNIGTKYMGTGIYKCCGYINITAWGQEANDSKLINENKN